MTLIFYVLYLTICILTTFIVYVLDKKKARNGDWRTPEAVLLGLSILGGALGGYIAMYLVHHKTKRLKFHIVNAVGLVCQGAILAFLIFHPNILF